MKTSQIALIWAIFVIAIQPCYDVIGSSFNSASTARDEDAQTNQGDIGDLGSQGQRGFQPIRISVYYSLWDHLVTAEQNALKRVIHRAVNRLQDILAVRRLHNPLLLSRKACQGKWNRGINKGKCGKIQEGYSGEFCMDNFRIPDSHLGKFEVYNSYDETPENTYFEDGEGLNNTDFVLYITSLTTEVCNPHKISALAYASFCQLGEFNRPVAGQVNFCPRNLKAQKFDEGLIYTTCIHELLHTLGFSSKLFDKFVQCHEDDCQPWSKEVLSMRGGRMRLVTDAVVREMRNHFNCTEESLLGGLLEIVRGKVTSHWDPYLMYSSVMGSREQKPYASLIDRISLAVFEDSGWYRVNYSRADPFLWGRGQGCNFGRQDLCKTQIGFCSENSSGCHHLGLSKARCNVETSNSSCGIFAADQIPCFHRPVNDTIHWDEVYVPTSRCFMSNATKTEDDFLKVQPVLQTAPRCYETRCGDSDYFVRLNGGQWTSCPAGSHTQVLPYAGFVQCPSYEEICSFLSVSREQTNDGWAEREKKTTQRISYTAITPTGLYSAEMSPRAKNTGVKISFYVVTGSHIFLLYIHIHYRLTLL